MSSAKETFIPAFVAASRSSSLFFSPSFFTSPAFSVGLLRVSARTPEKAHAAFASSWGFIASFAASRRATNASASYNSGSPELASPSLRNAHAAFAASCALHSRARTVSAFASAAIKARVGSDEAFSFLSASFSPSRRSSCVLERKRTPPFVRGRASRSPKGRSTSSSSSKNVVPEENVSGSSEARAAPHLARPCATLASSRAPMTAFADASSAGDEPTSTEASTISVVFRASASSAARSLSNQRASAAAVASRPRQFQDADAWILFMRSWYCSHVSSKAVVVHASLMYFVSKLGAIPPLYGWRACFALGGCFCGSTGATYVPSAMAFRRWRSFFPSFFFFPVAGPPAGAAAAEASAPGTDIGAAPRGSRWGRMRRGTASGRNVREIFRSHVVHRSVRAAHEHIFSRLRNNVRRATMPARSLLRV